MKPNIIYTNKKGELSPFRRWIGINFTVVWDWITLIAMIGEVLALLCLKLFTNQTTDEIILLIVFPITLLFNILNAYVVEQYIYDRAIDSKEIDKTHTLITIFSGNLVMFILMLIKLQGDDKLKFRLPFSAYHKASKKNKKVKKTKQKKVKTPKKDVKQTQSTPEKVFTPLKDVRNKDYDKKMEENEDIFNSKW